MAKFSAKKETAKRLGIKLLLVTENQIRVYPLLNNLKILHRYIGIYELNETQKTLLNLIKNSGRMSVSDIAKIRTLTMGQTRAQIYSLINKGIVKADLINDDLVSNPYVWSIA
jgi:predicted DNA-binding transcriptional regulator